MKKLLLFFISIYSLSISSKGQVVFGQNKQSSDNNISINYGSPKEFEIADIEVQGIQYLDNNALISLSGLKVGDQIKIPGDEITMAIKKLWKQGIIGNISIEASKIEGNQIWVIINLTERPRLTRYKIEGLSRNQKTEMEDDIELVRGKILTDVVKKNTEISVKKYLEGKGYLNANVRILEQPDTVVRNGAILVIRVDKGKKVKISDIYFEGNESFTDVKLRGKMKTTGELARFTLPSAILKGTIQLLNPKNFWHFVTNKTAKSENDFKDVIAQHVKLNVFKAAKYVRSSYEEDKDMIVDFYNSKGYRDMNLTYDTVYMVNEKHLNVKIGIEEGNKYYFRDISWSGNFIYPDETLDAVLGIKEGDVYNLELVNKKLNFDPAGVDISSLYMDNGYLFFNVTPVEVGVENDSIDVEMRMYEGAQATINEVIISGNEKTNEFVIRRELRTIPGRKFSRAELIRTQRELAQLGYFNPEKVNPVPKPNPVNETVDIEWQLEEQPSDQIQLSGGWGGAFGFVGTVGVNFNNFSIKKALGLKTFPPMGDGQKLSIAAQANGRRYQSYSLSFSEPWLGGRKPNNFGISYTYSIQRFLNRNFETTGSLEVQGVTLSLGRRVQWPDDFFIVSNSISFLKYDLFQFGNRLGFSTGDANNITFNTTIARRSADSPMYPRRGSEISLSMNFTPPYSLFNDIDYETAVPEERYKWVEFHKWNFDAKYYLQIIEKLVFAPRIHFGFIGSYTNETGVGPFERFVLGGDGLTGQNFLLGTDLIGLRGYPNPQSSLGSSNSVTPFDPDISVFGGTLFTKFVMELRYPISLSPTATIYVLGFVEGGNNWLDFSEYNPYNLKRSAGMGVRIFMPAFGLLGLDYGYGFDPAFGSFDPAGGQFHFSIGQQIR